MLYRFHSVISLRDEKWLNDFFKSLFPDFNKPLDQLNPQELLQGLLRYEQGIDADPSKREFGGLKRGPDGKFKDGDLVQLMKESIEDPAGRFSSAKAAKCIQIRSGAQSLLSLNASRFSH